MESTLIENGKEYIIFSRDSSVVGHPILMSEVMCMGMIILLKALNIIYHLLIVIEALKSL